MKLWELIVMGIGLGMDSFAVSTCKGLAIKKLKVSHSLKLGFSFGFFQALMTVIGFFLGKNFVSYIEKVDHWIAFGLLLVIGANMIKEGIMNDGENQDDDMSIGSLTLLGIAVSIDALTVGVMLGILGTPILVSSIVIGITSFIMAYAGSVIGHRIGTMFGKPAYIIGGSVLILLGLKILLEHLGILSSGLI